MLTFSQKKQIVKQARVQLNYLLSNDYGLFKDPDYAKGVIEGAWDYPFWSELLLSSLTESEVLNQFFSITEEEWEKDQKRNDKNRRLDGLLGESLDFYDDACYREVNRRYLKTNNTGE